MRTFAMMCAQWAEHRQPSTKLSHASSFFDGNLIGALEAAAHLLVTAIGWTGKRLLFRDEFAGHAANHIRFGPNATATDAKPASGKAHP